MALTTEYEQPWFLKSSYPVLFPFHDALRKPQPEFETFLRDELSRRHDEAAAFETGDGPKEAMTEIDESEAFTLVSNTTSGAIRKGLEDLDVSESTSQDSKLQDTKSSSHPFMQGLVSYGEELQHPTRNLDNMMLTENDDLAYRSTNNALVDLFQELEDVISGARLAELLPAAWKTDSLATLKIIFNARSIHLGKSSRVTFYRCAGWLVQNHPLTLIANLQWLSRPIIDKKSKKEDEEDVVVVDEKPVDDGTRYDVTHGVAHGYWKDLLNILALAANDQLGVLSKPRDVLNSENPGIRRGKSIVKLGGRRGRRAQGAVRARGRGGLRGQAGRGAQTRRGRLADQNDDDEDEPRAKRMRLGPKEFKHRTRDSRYEAAVQAFNTNPVYRALHLTIARLFAEQLNKDIRTLRGHDNKAKRSISLCGKWAPSHDHFHDRHTFIVSTIAEILYPRDSLCSKLSPTDDREKYLRFAREEYRKDTSALRKHLEIVERDITTRNYDNIKYDRIPSLAMSQYSKLFIENNLERFEKYIDKVAEGKANISGATLLPSTLIRKLRAFPLDNNAPPQSAKHILALKTSQIEAKVLDGQWNSLVQRIKDSGILESSIAVCDVSGSMCHPSFPDQSNPMDSAIGLSLLIAEVAKPPFGGAFITFSANPVVERVDLGTSLQEKYDKMRRVAWGMNTNFVAVFEDLILPMAIKNNLQQEDMVKRIFVFSDMQFDEAETPYLEHHFGSVIPRWSTSFERIKEKYERAGYEMPELVFWNLAGGRAGYGGKGGDSLAPKTVTSEENGTCLVSGYSQGMLKVFLDGGSYEDPEEEEVVIERDKDGKVKEKKVKMDPIKLVKRAIGHKAYDVLKVVD
ncbi:hypothetical protein FZEAL_10575 [Fusarium zealandicum]|uniref:DUF2828 domain-containing protein n=1 Tax=Fusarium zealandicum TaxID=1053134 RepID=A0A8H4TZQ1_9HYPO|nr:hypothetical protein FZEAL_10575 [Fusarium zealandicum]